MSQNSILLIILSSAVYIVKSHVDIILRCKDKVVLVFFYLVKYVEHMTLASVRPHSKFRDAMQAAFNYSI